MKLQERIGEAPASELGYFWQLYADLRFEKLYETGVVGQHGVEAAIPVYEKIVEDYSEAQDYGRELTGPSLRHYIQSLVALGRDKKALSVMDTLTGSDVAYRYTILRHIIERRRSDSPQVDQAVLDAIEPLMARFRKDIESLPDTKLAREQEIWADGFQASLMLEAGHPQAAINYLLRRIQRLAAKQGDDDLAPLIVKLAMAYQEVDELREAEQRYLHAQQLISPTDDLNADILVGLGQLSLAQTRGKNVEQALEFFREAEEGYPSSADAHIAALTGRATCEANLGDHAAAVHYFELAVRAMLDRTRKWDPRRKDAKRSLYVQFERAVDMDKFDRAKDYLDVLAILEGDEPSPEISLMMQETVTQFFSHLGDGPLVEIAVAKLEGYSNAEIARRCGCSERTIERRLHLIREKHQQEMMGADEHPEQEATDRGAGTD